jgi:hypothetical protein
MNVPRRSEGGAALTAAPAPAPAPYPNDRPFGGPGTSGSGQTLIKKEEEETRGQLRDRQALASAWAAVPGQRAVFVHIKIEDTDGEQGGGGEVDEATGGERDVAGEVERDEQEEEAAEADGGKQRVKHTKTPSFGFEGRTEAGAAAVASPQRARPPPGTYADTTVEFDLEPPMVAFGHIGMTTGSFSEIFMVLHGNVQIRMRYDS